MILNLMQFETTYLVTNANWYVLDKYYEERKLVNKPPPIHGLWVTEPERQQRK